MSKKYPNWSKEDWPWVKGSWIVGNVIPTEELTPLWYSGGFPIDDINFVFPKSKYEGLSISEMVRKHPRAVALFMIHRNIYVYPSLIEKLTNISKGKKQFIRRVSESFLTFEKIDHNQPLLISKSYASHYDRWSLLDIIDDDPMYLPYVIEKTAGRLRIDISFLQSLITDDTLSSIAEVIEECISKMEEIYEDEEYRKREYESEMQRMADEEEIRWYQNEGYRDVFDGYADAEWNID